VCRKNPCINKTLAEFELRTLVPTGTILKMLGLEWTNNSESSVPYEPFWFINSTTRQCFRTFTRNYCGENETLAFFGAGPHPECRAIYDGPTVPKDSLLEQSVGLAGRKNDCPEGYIHEGNDCVRIPTKKLSFKSADEDDDED
jgi:hypothetical protein